MSVLVLLALTVYKVDKVRCLSLRDHRLYFPILDPRSQWAGSYKFGAVIVNV